MKESASYHMVESSNRYVEIVLPLALPNTFTYYVPEDLVGDIRFGMRVEVPFGKVNCIVVSSSAPNQKPIQVIVQKRFFQF